MRKLFAYFICFLCLISLLFSNEYSYTIEKNIATALFPAKTYDEVWAAIFKTTMASNYRLNVSEKEAGIIEAEHIRSGSTRAWVGKNTEEPRLSIIVEKKDEVIYVSLKWDRGEKVVMRSMKSQRKKIYGDFFQKIADILYPPEQEQPEQNETQGAEVQ